MKPPRTGEVVDPPERKANRTIIALILGLILLVVIIAYFATSKTDNQDRLTNSKVATAPEASPEKLCASNAVYEILKRELFRRAAQLRGSDQAAYDRLANYASVRMENPVEESEDSKSGTINCSGSLFLDLPPGVAVAGGRRNLMSEVDYSVSAQGSGSGMLAGLRNADAIVTPLATLVRSGPAATEPARETPGNESEAELNSAVPEATGAAPPSAEEHSVSARSRPSFDCTKAQGQSQIAICADPALGVLDRQVADEYAHAFSVATQEQRVILRDTARRFTSYRDRCPTKSCVSDAYNGRVREIRDIIEGRWQASQ